MTTAGRKVTVESGATLTFGNDDGMGSFQYKSPVTMIADGGTIQNGSGRFLAIGDVVLRNGATLNTQNGKADAFQAFNLRGMITVAGSSGSFITTTGTTRTGIHLGGDTIPATTFNVAATGDPTADLTISAPLRDEVRQGAGGLIKTGAGTMVMTVANSYTGTTTVSGGTLALAVDGSFANTAMVSLGTGSRLDLTSKTAGFSFGEAQTLAGTGLVSLGEGRDLTILGSLAPGQSPGTLSLDGNLVLGPTSTSLFEIDGLTSGLYDIVQESGGARSVTFGGTLSLAFASGWSTEMNLKLFDFTSYAGSFSTVQATGLAAGYVASFNELSGEVEVTVVPEPRLAAVAVAALAAGIGLAARRRRQPA
jgi:autotransporter-associated beta strand protein